MLMSLLAQSRNWLGLWGLLLVVAIGGSVRAGSANTTGTVHGPLGNQLDAHLTKMVRRGYSGTVIVAKGGEIILQKGYGYADREKGRPVTPDTVFTIGSISKQFTGAAIVKLEMQGKLRVTDTIGQYLENVPGDKQAITLHQLLTHTSGLPNAIGSDFDTSATRDAFLRLAMGAKLESKPGTKHNYSNVGYSLLGMVIERASGMGYEAYLREHLFKPSGMLHTGYQLPEFDEASLAIGYKDDKVWGTVLGHPMLEDGPTWHLRANGGIHSTTGDMYKWHQALLGTKVLSDEAKTKYFAPHADEGYGDSFYGYGWVTMTTQRGTKLLAHNGGNMIFSADFRRYIDDDVVIFHATNNSKFSPDNVSEQLERSIFRKQ
jgi:CubicO group peptidase (beta-lactamase class C family)